MAASALFGALFEGYTPSIVLGVTAVLLVCWQRLSVSLDPREPPLIKPTIPFIGHIIELIKDHNKFFDRLSDTYAKPIITLPMLNGKMYVITSPSLIQSAYRNKNLSFEPFMVDFVQRVMGLSSEPMNIIKSDPNFVGGFINATHGSLLGQHLQNLNADVLSNVAVTINGIGESFEPESLFLWARAVMTMATCDSLLGTHNPMKDDASLVDALWDFEAGMMLLVLDLLPSMVAPRAYSGREKLQAALGAYYTKEYDLEPGVAQITKVRAAHFRKYKMNSMDIGRLEIALVHVTTANAIPTLFWLIAFIAADPELTATIRAELASIITMQPSRNDKREAHLDITKFDRDCPLLVSCYRESIRLTNSQVGVRRVMADTTISDGTTDYLLRKGADIQIPSGISHTATATWGADSASFNPRRFMKPEQGGATANQAKEEKRAYVPFGGGKHLCPGRNFAFAEILGFTAALFVGFDVKARNGELLQVPAIRRANMAEAVAKPFGPGLEMGARFTRMEGWEDVVFKFVTE